jgi:hypothetical protein
MSRLLYGLPDLDYPETDPCEITVVLTQAQLYAGGSYKLRYPVKENGRALVDMCMQLSAVALAVVTVGCTTGQILNPHQTQIGKIFSAAETALLSKHPERAADILEAIPSGTPQVLDAKRLSIFNQSMIARARTRTQDGMYTPALADLARVPRTSAEAPSAHQLLRECKNLQTFHSEVKLGLRLSTAAGVTDTASQPACYTKTDSSPLTIATAPAINPAGAATAPATQPLPRYPVSPYKAFRTALNKPDAPTSRSIPTSPAALKVETSAPAESLLPPQLLPPSPEGASYWLQESTPSTDEPAAIAPDIEVPAAEIKPAETSPMTRLKREWKTAPVGKAKFADN